VTDPIQSSISLPASGDSRSRLRLSEEPMWLTPRANAPEGDSGFVERNGDRGAHCFGTLNDQVVAYSAPSPSPKSTPTRVPSLPTDSLPSPTSAPFSTSPEIQSLRDAVSSRLSLLVASLASPTASPASGEASRTNATSGTSVGESFGTFDPALPSSRTLGDSSRVIPLPRMVSLSGDFFSIAFCRTWPRFGTLANGTLYRQPTLERRTDGIASGSSAPMNSDWPTAAARDYKGARSADAIEATGRNPMTNSLEDAIQAVERAGPPRTASGPHDPVSGSTGGSRAESWSTPQQGDYRSPNLNPGARGTSESAMNGLLPQSEHALPAQAGGKLNPSWVETLMAFPIGWTQLPQKFTKPRKGTP
jgi:hypothetical protein